MQFLASKLLLVQVAQAVLIPCMVTASPWRPLVRNTSDKSDNAGQHLIVYVPQVAQAVLIPFMVNRERVAPVTTQAVRSMMLMNVPASFQVP